MHICGMKTFKNISELDGQTCKILLYAGIGSDEACIPSGYFVEMLDYAASYYKKCKLYINSPGGEVFDGIAIFKAIQECKMDIEIYIDGVAASIAFVIAMCGRPVHMSKYGRLMCHSIIGGIQGTVQEIEAYLNAAKSLQDTVIEILSKRTGLTTAEVEAKWFDGKDHWIKADEALALKLIDSIYDGVDVPVLETSDVTTLYNSFQNSLNPKQMFKLLWNRLGLKNEATEEEALAKVAELETESTSVKARLAEKDTEITSLKAKLAEKETAEAAALEAEIETTLTNAVTEGRIQDAQKPQFKAILKADKANGMAIINGLPKARRITNELGKGNEPEGSEKWSFEDYSKKDPKALKAMKANDFEKYSALFKAQYGSEPKK
jgi:ATP-dependent Clp endopeptidase proteolytic subunit ClpP